MRKPTWHPWRQAFLGAIALICVSAAALTAPDGASAAGDTASCDSAFSGHTDQQAADIINDFVTRRVESGWSQAKIDQVLQERLCLQRIDNPVLDDGTTVAPLTLASTNTAVTVTPPSIYWDGSAQRYSGISRWNWVNDSFSTEVSLSNGDTKNVGGADGFATSFSKSLSMTGFSATRFGEGPFASSATIAGLETSNSYGAGYSFQDQANCRWVTSADGHINCDYSLNVRSGQEVVVFKKSGTCRSVQGFASYTHTWSSTSVNSVGIGAYDISFAWSSTSNHWNRASQPGGVATVC